MLVHKGIVNFQCEICEKKFSLKCNLKQKTFSHNKVKGKECDICIKKFSQKGSLIFQSSVGRKTTWLCRMWEIFTDSSGRNCHIQTRHKKLSKKLKNNNQN